MTTKAPASMRIVRLEASNVKRLRAVSITPEGAVIQITGRNGQGKTSVLDAIAMALGGGKLQADRPVRKGAKNGEVVIDLDEITVRRTWTAGGGTTLQVNAKDGSRLSSPQAVLDKLVGDLTFDPLAFSRMDGKAQTAVLKRVAGLDAIFAKIDAERKEAAEERTICGRDLQQSEAKLAGLPTALPPLPDGPDEEVSVTALLTELEQANKTVQTNASIRAEAEGVTRIVDEIKHNIACLEKEIENQRAGLVQAEGHAKMVAERAAALAADPDVAAIRAKIGDSEKLNAAFRARKSAAATIGAMKQAQQDAAAAAKQDRADYAAWTRKIEDLDEKKAEALAGAKLPVPGLTIDEEAGVMLNGIPFAQASSSEQLRTSVAMGLAQNPRLRVMLVRDGSLLDSAALADLERIADEHDAQVWLERVTDGEPVGVVIEDGEVKETADAE